MAREIYSHDATHHEWLNQGFEEAPFDEKKSNYCHYRSQGFIHALNQLVTLDTTAVGISHIHGESGAGKTACLKSFQKMPSTYLQVYLPTAEGLSPINLLKTIHFHLKTKIKVVRKPCAEYIVNLAKQLTSQDLRLRIIIDDAHTVPESTFDIIQQLASIQPTGSHIQFLLASHHSIDSLHRNVEWEDLRVKTIHIPNLSAKETAKYIKLCLTQSRKELFQPQIPEELSQKIPQLSQGNIRRINQVAARHLLKHIELCKPNKKDTPSVSLVLAPEQKNFLVTSGLLLTSYLFARFLVLPTFYGSNTEKIIPHPASILKNKKLAKLQNLTPQDIMRAAEKNIDKLAAHKPSTPKKSPPTPQKVTLTEQHVRPKRNIQPLRVASSATISKAAPESLVKAALKPLANTAPPPAKKANTETLSTQIAQPATLTQPGKIAKPTPIIPAAKPAVAQNEKVAKPAQITQPAKVEQPSQKIAQPSNIPPVLSATKKTELKPTSPSLPSQEGFVIQLAALSLQETRARFCAAHKICNDKLIDYQAERHNNPMRIFVLGPYETKQAAHEALEKLPASLRKNKPWIKSYQSIQKEFAQQP